MEAADSILWTLLGATTLKAAWAGPRGQLGAGKGPAVLLHPA